MNMQRNNPVSLRSLILATGNVSSHVLAGHDSRATWSELAHGSVLQGEPELQGRSVLVATSHQFSSAAALIELDGVARRIVLFPPDVPREHLAYVAKTSEADALITDQPEIASMPHGIGNVVLCGRSVAPADRDRSARIQTEWILLTSGTTGLPKLAVHTLASLAGSGWHAGQPPTAVVWSTFYDMRRYGGMHIFLHACIAGTSMVLSSAHESTAEFLVRASAHGVTHISGTPSHWRRALMSPQATRIAPVYLRMSGEIVDQAILNQVRSQYPMARVDHTFASTEAGVGFYVSDGLMGFPPEVLASNPLIEMKVLDGTLRIRSNRTATRYLGEDTPVLKDSEGFVDTGDTIETRDGRCYFAGRRDGIINVGGRKVHPEEVEAVINRHPGVAMSLVRAKKNPITGALVIADVVLKNNSSQMILESEGAAANAQQNDILDFCRTELEPHKVPAAIHIVSTLSIGESGKLVRRHA
jgi:acyl-coenzyme A synthetase/AMP-(fatty) acid ligase